MKKIITKTLIALMAFLLISACSNKKEEVTEKNMDKKELVKIKVASHTKPMTTILELIQEDLKQEGYELELVAVTDNVQANVALKNKEVDANFFQHKLFMEMFNQGNQTDFIVAQPVYDAVVSFYGKDLKDINQLKEGSEVAVPSDPTNLTRALRLLASNNIITLKDPNSYNVKIEDIKDNPKNLNFTEIGLLNLNEAYAEKDLVFNYPAYAEKIGLNPKDNGLIFETGNDLTFAISVVVNKEDQDSEKIQALKKAITSEKVKKFIEENLKDVVKLAF